MSDLVYILLTLDEVEISFDPPWCRSELELTVEGGFGGALVPTLLW